MPSRQVLGSADAEGIRWFFGANNPGNEKGNFLFFAGGVPVMREIFADVAAKGYEGFVLS